MSFLDSIVDVGSSVWNWATGSSTSAGIARATALSYMLKEVQSSINKDNEAASKTITSETATAVEKDYGVREQVDPDTNHTVPVVYGHAFLGGIVTDAVLSADNQTMWYCITVCERTGIKMSNGQQSTLTFQNVFWNNSRIVFQADGITAAKLVDEEGNESSDINGLVQFYFFNNGSTSPCNLAGKSGSSALAYNVFPNWTNEHTMDELVFAIVKVTYNAPKYITGLGTLQFEMTNDMKKPGDCIYDLMTNTRYGGGVVPEEIYQ